MCRGVRVRVRCLLHLGVRRGCVRWGWLCEAPTCAYWAPANSEKLERKVDYDLTYQQRHRHRHQRLHYSTKDCVKLLPSFCFPNHDHELELERSRTLFQPTYVSTVPLFFLFNISASAFSFPFHQHLLAFSFTPRFTHLDDLFDLLGFWLCIHSSRPPIHIQYHHPFLQLSRSLLRMLSTTSCVSSFPTSLTFTLLPCFDTILYSCSRFPCSCFRIALQDSHRRYLSPLF